MKVDEYSSLSTYIQIVREPHTFFQLRKKRVTNIRKFLMMFFVTKPLESFRDYNSYLLDTIDKKLKSYRVFFIIIAI